MPSYEQIKSLEKQLYEVLSEFQYVIDNNDFKEIFINAKKYESEKNMPSSFLCAEHDKMMCRLYTYFINNIPRHTALKMILNEFNHKTPIIISRIVDDIYITQTRRLRPQKIYAAHMMKLAGVANKRIAAVLGVTVTTAAKYLKMKLEID